MVEYVAKGLKFYYPEFFQREGDFPYLGLSNPESEPSGLSVALTIEEVPFELIYHIAYNPEIIMGGSGGKDSKIEIIRAGDYLKFSQSKELLSKVTFYDSQKVEYHWRVIIPLDKRFVEVSVFDNCLVRINETWKLIVDSMEFDPEKISCLVEEKEEDIVKLNWTREAKKPRHYQLESFKSEVGLKAIYNANREPIVDFMTFSDDSQFLLNGVQKKHFFKLDNTLALSDFTDPVEFNVDFYFGAQPPQEKNWLYIIEAMLKLYSGELYFGEYIDDEPELEIKVKPGVYKFWLCFGENKAKEECWRIYFWPTDEPETNEVKIIKPYSVGPVMG